jgi:hypothetical protein
VLWNIIEVSMRFVFYKFVVYKFYFYQLNIGHSLKMCINSGEDEQPNI